MLYSRLVLCLLSVCFQESPTYEILMTLQSIAQVHVGFGFLICVNFGVVIAMLIGGQYDILAVSNKNIWHTAMFKAGRITELRLFDFRNDILLLPAII